MCRLPRAWLWGGLLAGLLLVLVFALERASARPLVTPPGRKNIKNINILAAASQLQLLEGIVMVPYLTPYGAALRRQRQPIDKELLDKGLRPSWRGGATLRYTDSSGNSVMYDFEAGPAA